MCERKPGPRCSPDTLKALQQANQELAVAVAEYNKVDSQERLANSQIKGSPYRNSYDSYDWDYFDDQLNILSEAVYAARRKAEELEITYDATPDGIKTINQLLATVGQAVRIENRESLDDWEREGDGFSDWQSEKVNIRIPKKEDLKQRLALATAHREWQTKVSKILAQDEAVSPHKALFLAEGFKTELEKQKRDAPLIGREYYQTLNRFYHDPSEKNEVAAAKLLLSIREREVVARYRAIEIADLESYISTLKKKLKADREEELATV